MVALSLLAFVLGVTVVVTTVLSAVRTVVVPRGLPVRLTRAEFLAVRWLRAETGPWRSTPRWRSWDCRWSG